MSQGTLESLLLKKYRYSLFKNWRLSLSINALHYSDKYSVTTRFPIYNHYRFKKRLRKSFLNFLKTTKFRRRWVKNATKNLPNKLPIKATKIKCQEDVQWGFQNWKIFPMSQKISHFESNLVVNFSTNVTLTFVISPRIFKWFWKATKKNAVLHPFSQNSSATSAHFKVKLQDS